MNSCPVRLREHVPSDIERFCELQMSSQVARYVSWLPRTRAQCEHALADAIAQQRSAERIRFFYAVECQHVKGMIGSVGYTIRDSVSADCGWFLLPDFWGKGYATHAICALLVLAFGSGRMMSLTASCAIENRASLRVAEKCGFRLIATISDRCTFEIHKEEVNRHSVKM
ncbi:GNAT family N-acetyltransferase [Burkholderia cepacia]|uniref:GNAT family N-acetyltransferase n=1 Tax=Burkholderia cepacia TaxID=292 RepID=UPI001CF4CEF7|nr:GNAT family N-acetyltransferase [Burkholderia cepacia]MCA8055691.1 GNAT family N-acetyltransferase [Burkholderia cepacia]MCA8135886.1 GNAT family N-acetyltransferase [Burkholderia cepacia]